MESCVGHAEKGPADCKINLRSPAGRPLKCRVPGVFADRLGSALPRSMVTLSCTVSVSYLPIISLGMHSQSYLLTLALLINSIIGLDRCWDNAQETLSWTRIPLPGFGSIGKQNPLWDISCGPGVPEDLAELHHSHSLKCFFVLFCFFEEEEISILFPLAALKWKERGRGRFCRPCLLHLLLLLQDQTMPTVCARPHVRLLPHSH